MFRMPGRKKAIERERERERERQRGLEGLIYRE